MNKLVKIKFVINGYNRITSTVLNGDVYCIHLSSQTFGLM